MKIGTLCRVIKFKTHRPCQYNDMVVIIGSGRITPIDLKHMGPLSDQKAAPFLRGTNLKTGKTHHYWSTQLEPRVYTLGSLAPFQKK
jgi:hypothetical protein